MGGRGGRVPGGPSVFFLFLFFSFFFFLCPTAPCRLKTFPCSAGRVLPGCRRWWPCPLAFPVLPNIPLCALRASLLPCPLQQQGHGPRGTAGAAPAGHSGGRHRHRARQAAGLPAGGCAGDAGGCCAGGLAPLRGRAVHWAPVNVQDESRVLGDFVNVLVAMVASPAPHGCVDMPDSLHRNGASPAPAASQIPEDVCSPLLATHWHGPWPARLTTAQLATFPAFSAACDRSTRGRAASAAPALPLGPCWGRASGQHARRPSPCPSMRVRSPAWPFSPCGQGCAEARCQGLGRGRHGRKLPLY